MKIVDNGFSWHGDSICLFKHIPLAIVLEAIKLFRESFSGTITYNTLLTTYADGVCAVKCIILSVQSVKYDATLNFYDIPNHHDRWHMLISIGYCEGLHCCNTR